jgi:hypothetical protein
LIDLNFSSIVLESPPSRIPRNRAETTKANFWEDGMAITRELMDTTRIRRTMRVLPYEEAKERATRFVEGAPEEAIELMDWDYFFEEYIEEHKNSKLLFCWYAQGVGIVFSPSDHHGIWAMQREGVKAKGILPKYALEIVERIAQEKALE